MTLNRTTNDIKTYSGQVFTAEKFSVDKITNWIRLMTGLSDLLVSKFTHRVLEDFCEKTWILRKLIQVGAVLTEVETDSQYYMVEIDLTDYADGLLVHDINELIVNNRTHLCTKDAYLGDPTGSNEIESSGSGTYIESGTYIGPATYLGPLVTNQGELTDGYHYEIKDDTTIKIWPVQLEDVILVPIIFKTSSIATEIPYLLENYYEEIASGIIAKIRKIPRHEAKDEAYHEMNYQKGVSKGKYEYAKQYKGNQVQETYFAI